MSGTDKLKATFLRNSKLRQMFDGRVQAATRDIKAGLATIGKLPPGDTVRNEMMSDALALNFRVKEQQTIGQNNPGAAFVSMAAICQDAANFARQGPQRVTVQEQVVKHAQGDFDDAEKEIGQKIIAAGKARALIASETEAGKIGERIAGLEKDLRSLSGIARDLPGSIGDHKNDIDKLKTSADQVLNDAVKAQSVKAEEGTARQKSHATMDMVGGITGLGAKFSSTDRDARGRTVSEEAALRLQTFDEKFATDEADTKGKIANTAMRLTAVLSATAAKAAKDVNDPHLEGRIGQLMVREYGGDLAGKLTEGEEDNQEQQKAAKQALKIAQALLMDDPIGKLMTGKIRPEDAVQRIRDQAQLADLKPSDMMALLRQQFEMKLATLSGDEIVKASPKNDKNQEFVLNDLQGELSSGQAKGMMEFGTRTARTGVKETTTPQWTKDGGLAFKPLTQVIHVGKSGETLREIAATYLGDASRAGEIMEGNRGVLAKVLETTPKDAVPDLTGIKLKVPDERQNGRVTMLDEIAKQVGAWDTPEVDQPDILGSQAPKWKKKDKSNLAPLGELPPIPEIDPVQDNGGNEEKEEQKSETSTRNRNIDDPLAQQLRARAEKLVNPAEGERLRAEQAQRLGKQAPNTLPNYIQAPGLTQDHKVRPSVEEDEGEQKEKEKPLSKGAINERQYAHLRMLQRADDEEKQAFADETGRSIEDFVIDRIVERHKIDRDKAKQLIADAAGWFGRVPLTITFRAESLFSDPGKDAPTYGAVYKSEVEFSRGEKDAKELIGRDDNIKIKESPKMLNEKGEPQEKEDEERGEQPQKLGTTGGTKGTWNKDRGENYMRWRRDKDSREGRLDELAYEDQQIFGAVNPNFDQQHGTDGEQHGKNYYGDAHFLLADGVRQRVAFCVRGGGISVGGGKSSVQRTDLTMMLHDMIKGGEKNMKYMDALLLKAKGSTTEVMTKIDWEVHIFGGFDIRTDAKEMWLSPKLADDVKQRIQNFAAPYKIGVQFYAGAPTGIKVISSGTPTPLTLELQ